MVKVIQRLIDRPYVVIVRHRFHLIPLVLASEMDHWAVCRACGWQGRERWWPEADGSMREWVLAEAQNHRCPTIDQAPPKWERV